MISQELEQNGEELKLRTHFNTDDEEKINWESTQHTNGFIYENKKLVGREVARIPVEEAAMLETLCDIDYLSFSRNGDKNAFRRLLARFPHWRCASGGI